MFLSWNECRVPFKLSEDHHSAIAIEDRRRRILCHCSTRIVIIVIEYESCTRLLRAGCTCAGKKNKYGEGGSCAAYSGYGDPWFNGRWCYADVTTCADAKAHATNHVPGYGASKEACKGPLIF